MKKPNLQAELGQVYPDGTDMKELVSNFIEENKSLKERENNLNNDVNAYEDFLNNNY